MRLRFVTKPIPIPMPPNYYITGRVTDAGVGVEGVTFAVSAGASCPDSDADGYFTCTVPSGWTGTITPAFAGRTFSPVYRSYTAVAADSGTQTFSADAAVTAGTDTVWVEDAIPAGAGSSASANDVWNFVGSNPTPFSGSLAHQTSIITGSGWHAFYSATTRLTINTGDALFCYVYIDPANVPSQIILQWLDAALSWGHGAYWGSQSGVDGPERRYMGSMPASGGWVRLEIPANLVGLEGQIINGMFFALVDGRVTWDKAGKTSYTFVEPPVEGQELSSSFQLTSAAASGTYPFTIGLGFGEGEISSGSINVSDCVDYQVIAKRTWNDGSLKHALVAGRAALTQNVTKTFNLTAGTAPTGTALTAASIVTANPSASIQCGAIGTVTLASLLASPIRTWISGHEMVECHYRSAVGADPNLVAFFHVRLFADNRVWVRCIVENGYLDNGGGTANANTDSTYVPTFSVGGSSVYTNGGAALTHYANTRLTAEGWIGGDPQITPKHNVAHLRSTKLVPNYYWTSPTEGGLNALTQTYAVNSNGDINLNQADTGGQTQIGWLPWWDAMYAANGDPRSYRAMLANGSMINNYAISYRSRTTGLVPKLSDYPTWTVNGPNGNGVGVGFPVAGPRIWDKAHHGSAGYLAYLCTGDYWHYETMQLQAFLVWAAIDSAAGSGTTRILAAQTRGVAWGLRTWAQLSAIFPTGDAIAADIQAVLAYQMSYWGAVAQTPGINGIGLLYAPEMTDSGYGAGWMSMFQESYFGLSFGLGYDLKPLPDMTSWTIARNQLYKAIVGVLGPNGVDNYCFANADAYRVKISSSDNTDPTTWYDTWGQVFTASYGVDNTNCGNVIDDANQAATSTWGALLTWLATAVDHGAPGAAEAQTRLTNASNWATLAASPGQPATGGGFNDFPVFGIMSRDFHAWPAWRVGMALYETKEVPNSAISTIATSDWSDAAISGDKASMLAAFSGATINRATSKIYTMGNGGHSDYGGTQVLECDTARDSSASPRWSQLIAPIIGAEVAPESVRNVDALLTPASAHTYRQTQSDIARNKILRVGTTNCWGPNGFASSAEMISFNLDQNKYDSQANQLASPPALVNPDSTICTDPATGNIWVHVRGTQNIYVFNTVGNYWTQVSSTAPYSSYGVSCIDTRRNRLFYCCGDWRAGTTPPFTMDLAAPYTVTNRSLTGAGAANLVNAVSPDTNAGWSMDFQLADDPANDAFFLRERGANSFLWKVIAATFDAAVITVTGSGYPASDGTTGLQNRGMMAAPLLNGMFSLLNYAGDVIFTRTK